MKGTLHLIAALLFAVGLIDIGAHLFAGYNIWTEALKLPVSEVFWKLPIYFSITFGLILWNLPNELHHGETQHRHVHH